MSTVNVWREQLGAWLREWRIAEALEGEVGVGGDVGDEVGWADAGGDVEVPTAADVGQIRLLAPGGPGGVRGLWHLVVIDACGERGVLLAPYSVFATPALPGELRLSGDAPALRVLALWNAGWVKPGVLNGSWVLGRLRAEDIGAIRAVRRYLELGEALPAALEARVGPPLLHPADPRHRYCDAARSAMRGLTGGGGVALHLLGVVPAGAVAVEALKVAEGGVPYGRTRLFRIGDSALRLRLTRCDAGYEAAVVTVGGVLSRRLDGGYLAAAGGARSLSFWEGRSLLCAAMVDAGLVLRYAEGQVLRLWRAHGESNSGSKDENLVS